MTLRLRALVGCESSGVVRDALRALGVDAYSCDVLPCEGDPRWHIRADVRGVLHRGWDLGIFHPPCTRLTNSGVRWLHVPPPGRTLDEMWADLDAAAAFYVELRNAPIPFKAIENPIMHRYARERIQPGVRQVVQPWWFGEPQFKATGFELVNLPPLVATNRLTPPRSGTPEHKAWSKVHRASPGPDRWKERSRTLPGIARAMAAQWSTHIIEELTMKRTPSLRCDACKTVIPATVMNADGDLHLECPAGEGVGVLRVQPRAA